MNEKTILNMGRTFFWTSFLLGNFCLFGYIFTKNGSFAECGLLVLGWGFIINLAAVLTLTVYGIFNKSKQDICLKSAGIMLINVPIAMIYVVIGLSLITI